MESLKTKKKRRGKAKNKHRVNENDTNVEAYSKMASQIDFDGSFLKETSGDPLLMVTKV